VNLSRIRVGLLSASRGLLLALLAPTVALALFILSVLSVAFTLLGVGMLLVPMVNVGVRGLTDLQRRLAQEWSGVRIERPYRQSVPAPPGTWNRWQLYREQISDPATWRDLLWLLVEVPVGLVLGLLPACLIVYGVEGIVAVPLVHQWVSGYGYGTFWPVHGFADVVLAQAEGIAALGLGLVGGPAILVGHAQVARSLIGPTGGPR